MTPSYAIVSGGSGALGTVVVDQLLAAGTAVVVLDRETRGRTDVEEICVDLADPAALLHSIGTLLEANGAPAGLVLCHGWSPKGLHGTPLEDADVTADLFTAVLTLNLTSCFLLLQSVVPAMAAGGGGRVVAVGSAAALTGRSPASVPYSASKAGLAAVVRSFAVRYGRAGVLVNDVCPGKMANPSWGDSAEVTDRYAGEVPLGRLANASEVADAILFLISTRNTYITGQTVIVDGGRLA